MSSDDDTTAVGATKALQEYGYKVPDDIVVAGRPNSEITTPPLATIDENRHLLGVAAIDTLVDLIDGKSENNFKFRINT
ncbi:substrate-binding domain-containing protein [Enterococcus hulanensis]|uniref:substrate-binding domain-containing protein n=1 Tax=Enterococcus TaxID=1350 RepID=UPI000B5A9FB5|nr:substrate-binding domain-containing protein [Enterococcus hulanensis]